LELWIGNTNIREDFAVDIIRYVLIIIVTKHTWDSIQLDQYQRTEKRIHSKGRWRVACGFQLSHNGLEIRSW
jgi:hypothetical protein